MVLIIIITRLAAQNNYEHMSYRLVVESSVKPSLDYSHIWFDRRFNN